MAAKGEPISKGFAVGLQIWLLFLISLYGLGYDALFSITLGAIGGFASGFIVEWWIAKDGRTEPEKKQEEEGVEEVAKTRRKKREKSALNHRRRRRDREPVTLKSLSKTFFSRPENRNEE